MESAGEQAKRTHQRMNETNKHAERTTKIQYKKLYTNTHTHTRMRSLREKKE